MENKETENLNWLSDKVNRSYGQTKFLYDLCDNNFEKLKSLEVQLKNCYLMYCPADKEAVSEVMPMTPLTNKYSL